MYKTNIKKLGVVLAVMVLAGLVLAGAGAAHENHDVLTWTAWTAADSLPDTAGNYYLACDVNLASTWSPENGTNLCLDGHTVKMNGSGSVISIGTGVSFGLYDCGNTGKITGGNVTTQNDGGGICVNGGTFTMTGGEISGNHANNAGGGVYVNNGIFTMTGGSIRNNTSNAYGGGVFIDDGGRFTMSGSSEISGNSASNNGGGVYIQGYFEFNSGTISGQNTAANAGGGVYVDSGTFIMNDGGIFANGADKGGGVYVTGGTFTMKGGMISSNTNPGGKEVHITDAARYDIPDSVESVAYIGIHDGWTQLNLKSDIDWLFKHGGKGYLNADFDGTYLQYNGKTTYLDLNGHKMTGKADYATLRVDGILNLYDSVGTGYITEGNYGEGGVYVKNRGEFNFYTGTIKDCSVSSCGAGVYDAGFFGMHEGAVISNCHSYDDDDCSGGGGVYILTYCSFAMYGGLIENCTAMVCGGGVYQGSNSEFIMTGGTIKNCFSKSYGGGVYVGEYDGTCFKMYNGQIDKCRSSYNGGGVYLDNSSNLTMWGGAEISGCTAGNGGGGVFSTKRTGVLMIGGKITGCTAENGGGVYMEEHDYLTMEAGAEISRCTADNKGGGVYMDGEITASSDFTMKDGARILNCTATESVGGGLYVGGFKNNFKIYDGALISGCTSENEGGGVYVLQGTARNNVLEWNGGHIKNNSSLHSSYNNTYPHASSQFSIACNGVDGATIVPGNPETYYKDSDDIVLTQPVKSGAVFKGWTGTGLDEPVMTVVIPNGSSGDRSYTANWTGTVTVAHVDHTVSDGTAVPVIADSGTEITLTEPVCADGYEFTGWTSEPSVTFTLVGEKYTFTMPVPAAGITVTPVVAAKVTHPVTVNQGDHGSGGSASPASAYTGQEVTLIPPSASPGYTFIGWDSDPLVAIQDNKFSMPGEAVTVTALYTEKETKSVTVTHVDHTITDGTSNVTKAYAGQVVTLTKPVCAEGYECTGWTSVPVVTVTDDRFIMPDGDVTVTPTVVPRAVHNVVVQNGAHGSGGSASPASAYSGQEVTLIPPVANAGWTFSGWTSNQVTVTDNRFTMPDGDVTVTAQYTAKPTETVTVTHVDHTTLDGFATPASAYSGQEVTLTEPVCAEGYEFTGWTSGQVTVLNNSFIMPDPAVAVTVTPAVEAKAYHTVTVDSGEYGAGGSASPSSAYSGQTVTLTEPAVTGTGMIFAGWTSVPAVTVTDNRFTMPDGDVTVTALYTAEPVYDVAVNAGEHGSGGLASPETAREGQEVTLTPPDADSGWKFSGWTSDQVTVTDNRFNMPAKNVVVTGQYTQKTCYTVSFNANGHGTDPTDQQIYEGECALKPEDPVAVGYRFEGWFEDSACSSAYDFNTPVSSNITLYAKWSEGGDVTLSTNSVMFGTATVKDGNYTVPAARTVKITNNSTESVQVDGISSDSFTISGLSSTIGSGETVTFTVQPKSDLACAGEYKHTITVARGQDIPGTQNLELTIRFSLVTAPEESEKAETIVPKSLSIELKEDKNGNTEEILVDKNLNGVTVEDGTIYLAAKEGDMVGNVILEIANGTVINTETSVTSVLGDDSVVTARYMVPAAADYSGAGSELYSAEVVMKNVNTNLPTLSGVYRADIAGKVKENGYEPLLVVSSLNENTTDIDTNISTTTLRFRVAEDNLPSDYRNSYKIVHVSDESVVTALPTSFEDHDEYVDILGVNTQGGFSSYVLAVSSSGAVSGNGISTITSFTGEKNGNDFTFDRAVVITKATLPGATYATVTNTSGSGWYTCNLTTDGTNGVLYFQVPLDVINVKGYTVNDVSMLGCKTTYLTSEGGYARYSAVIDGAGSYTIDFEKDAAVKAVEKVQEVVEQKQTATEQKQAAAEKVQDVVEQKQTTQTSAKSPFPVLGILAGLGIAGVLVMRRK